MATYRINVIGQAPPELKPESLRGKSFFGHDPKLNIKLPAGQDLPAHLVLTLDNNDPRIAALGIDVGPKIRLVHPFHHSEGDDAAYRHLDGDAVEFTELAGNGDRSWPHVNFPAVLPSREIEIAEAGPKPQRDRGDASSVFLGSDAPTAQRYDGLKCGACPTSKLRLIASVPSRPMPGLNIWDNDFVFVLFWFCPSCKLIYTHNESD